MSDPDQVMRELAEENVVADAEEAAAGIRRLTVTHGLHPDQEAQREDLVSFDDDVCRHNRIETPGGVASRFYPGWASPPEDVVDAVALRTAHRGRRSGGRPRRPGGALPRLADRARRCPTQRSA